jgi:two-component system, chemotaxis family, protein-glutamate methylesterase/glutaminase
MPVRPVTAPAGVRAVVCDDSPFMRRFLSDALTRGGISVVGTAASGAEAIAVCAAEKPDVLTLDVQMPGMTGIEVLRKLPAGGPRVIVVSAHTAEGSAIALDALDAGAVDVMSKPGLSTPLDRFAETLAHTVRGAAAARRVVPPRRRPVVAPAPVRPVAARPVRPAAAAPVRATGTSPLLVVASSTGGPRALATLIPRLSQNGCGGLIVQHMPAGFTATLAARLDAASPLRVREARDGDAIEPGLFLLAPGDYHLHVEKGRVRLGQEASIGGLRPRADITLSEAAKAYGNRVVSVVLTGMGHDGLAGVRDVKAAGGSCFAEDESTCVVYGMPRAVAEARLTDAVRPLDELSESILSAVGR